MPLEALNQPSGIGALEPSRDWTRMQNSTMTLLFMGAIVLAGIPVAMIAKNILPGFIIRNSGVEEIEARLFQLQSDVHDLQQRVHAATAEANRLNGERGRLQSETRRMEKAAQDTALRNPEFVHELGEPRSGQIRFIARLNQDNPASQTSSSGERIEPNPIWRFDNLLEIWARNYDEARALADVSYPVKLGYSKTFLTRPNQTGDAPGATVGPTPRRPVRIPRS